MVELGKTPFYPTRIGVWGTDCLKHISKLNLKPTQVELTVIQENLSTCSDLDGLIVLALNDTSLEAILKFQGKNPLVKCLVVLPDKEIPVIGRELLMRGIEICCESVLEYELLSRIHALISNSKTRAIRELAAINTKLKERVKRLQKIAITDELTGLHTMGYFKARVRQEFIRATRYGNPTSIIMTDIDHFKSVNDTCDHLMGSYVLRCVGKQMGRSIRSDDIAARFGGDEFIILCPETAHQGALGLAERLKAALGNRTYTNREFKTRVTLSFGIATYIPQDKKFSNYEDLIARADHFLYEAKARGRDQIVYEKD